MLGIWRPEKGPGKLTTPDGVEVSGAIAWIPDSGNDRAMTVRITTGP